MPVRRAPATGCDHALVPASNIEIVRAGLDAYKRGDLDAVLELLDPNVRMDGVAGADPCLNREQAAEALRAGMAQAGDLELADAVPFGTDKVMVCLVRMGADEDSDDEDAPPARIYEVVSFAGEKVVRMQEFRGRRDAVQAARGVEEESSASGGGVAAKPKRKKSLWRRARMGLGRALGRG
jgi:ketosteroid isomerase-like protein